MNEWYQQLERPFFAPEPWVFGVAWGIIYPLIAMAFAWIVYLVHQGQLPKTILIPLIVNAVFNLSFTYIQFGLQSNILAALWISVVVGSLIWIMCILFHSSVWTPFVLLLPYLLWGLFATVLQFSITYLNI